MRRPACQAQRFIGFLSLGRDKLPWMAEGCTSDARFTSEMQADFLYRQRESVTDKGKKEQRTISIRLHGQSRQAAVNFE